MLGRMASNTHLTRLLVYSGACSSLRTTDIKHYTNILKCYKTQTTHASVHSEHHNLMKGQCLIWSQKIRHFSLAFCFSQLMKLSKADFPRGIITFRNIQHCIRKSRDDFFEGKKIDKEFFFTDLCIDKAILLERIDVSTMWPAVTINLCQFTQWIISLMPTFSPIPKCS